MVLPRIPAGPPAPVGRRLGRWLVLAVGAPLLVLVPLLVLIPLPARAAPAPQPCSAGSVQLTFDDGPNPTATPVVLHTLVARGDKATFFLVGSLVAAHPDVVRRESQDGERIGNHSWNHPNLTTLDTAQVKAQLQRTNAAIRQVIGRAPTLWRPPYGATDARVEAAARAVGLTTMVLWTVDPRDWADPPAATIRDRVLAAARPNAIILLHDGTGKNTPAALPLILDGLAQRGFCVR